MDRGDGYKHASQSKDWLHARGIFIAMLLFWLFPDLLGKVIT
jgi:hypothetical protein